MVMFVYTSSTKDHFISPVKLMNSLKSIAKKNKCIFSFTYLDF